MTTTDVQPSAVADQTIVVDFASLRRRPVVAEPLGHVPALDGLRALAVIAVVLYHSRVAWIPGGFLGVSAFFTLSGFLITSLLLREWTGSGGVALSSFWTRRFRRLLPASWTTLGLVVVLGAFGAWSASQLRSLRGDLPYSLAEIVNWHFIAVDRSYGAAFSAPSPLEHFWSLAVEQQFYVVLPLLVVVVLRWPGAAPPRRRLHRLVGVLAVLAVSSAVANGWLARGSVERAYYGTDTRAAELLVGALLACATLRRLRLEHSGVWVRRLVGLLGLAAGVCSLWLWHDATLRAAWLYPWGLLLTAWCTASIVVAALQGGALARALACAPLRWIGRLSYGIYLLHWPVFLVLTPARVGWGPWPLFALRMAVTLAAAVVSFHLIEQPVRSGRRLARPRGWIAALVVAPALLVANLLVTASAPPPTQLERVLSSAPASTPPPPPVVPVRVTVVGDELAASVGAALQAAGAATGEVQVQVATAPSCGLSLGGWISLPGGAVERDVDRCRAARALWIGAVQQQRPDVVLAVPGVRDLADRRLDHGLAWQGPGDPAVADFLRTDLGSFADSLAGASAQVVLLTVPHMRNAVSPTPVPVVIEGAAPGTGEHRIAEVEIERMAEGAPGRFAENDDPRVDQLNVVLHDVARSRGLHVLDLGGQVASWPEGPFDPALRADGVTLSGVGAERVGTWLATQLRDLTPAPEPAPAPPAFDVATPLPAAPAPTARSTVTGGQDPRLLLVGDSVAVDVALGMARWGDDHPRDRVRLATGARAGCPIARGGSYRIKGDVRLLTDSCDWGPLFPQLVAAHRPEVAVVMSGLWEVADRRLPGDDRFRHVGDPGVDRFVLIELLTAIDVLGAQGASVALVLQPHVEVGRADGFQGLPESDPARMDRYNELLREAAALRPGVVQLIDLPAFLAQLGEDDTQVRPDGVHFSERHSEIVGGWLNGEVRRIGGGG
jgi:peptidoglycan/LPS O-acetylase OafA/YrhL